MVLTLSGAQPANASHTVAVATLHNQAGAFSGTVRLIQQDGKVFVSVRAWNLTSGFHGFHIHTVGSCTADSKFVSAGTHHNNTSATHGSHSGDLPVAYVIGGFGTRQTSVTERVTVAELFDGDGSAFIIHEKPDNYANIPDRYDPDPDGVTLGTGDSGGRVLCGVIRRP